MNGKEAVKILNAYRIDLVVTDLRMPKMDGFELLAYMTKNYADIPVIVMTAFGTPEIENKIRSLRRFQYLEKPMDITVLANSIFNCLAVTPSKDSKQSINLSTFLHLIEMENTTCTLRVNSDGKNGFLYFDKGRLVSANTDHTEGEKAVLDMLSWNNAELDIKFKCETTDGNMKGTLSEILMETLSDQDTVDRAVENEAMAGEEQRRKAEETAKARAEEEARKAAEEKARKQAEDEARLKAKADEEKRRADKVTKQKLMAWKKVTKNLNK
jgi:CheY-like chemotaxis protein